MLTLSLSLYSANWHLSIRNHSHESPHRCGPPGSEAPLGSLNDDGMYYYSCYDRNKVGASPNNGRSLAQCT